MFPPYFATLRMPSSPPPADVPEYCPWLSGMGPELVERYLHLQVYAWMKDGQSFWMYPCMMQGGVAAAYIWNGLEWDYSSIPLDMVDSLQ